MLATNPSPEEEYNIKMSAASIYSGGADTVSWKLHLSPWQSLTSRTLALAQTVSAELTFILAMGLWPAVQRKAQVELDAVVGHDRLPTYADVAHMPYLNAVYLEVLRWNQVVPLGAFLPFRLGSLTRALTRCVHLASSRRAARRARRRLL